MTLVPVRALLILLAILTAIAFATGYLRWEKDQPGCFNGKYFYGDWHTTLSVGKLEWRQKDYGCPEAERYNKGDFKPLY